MTRARAQPIGVAGAVLMAALTVAGCATENFVRGQVAPVQEQAEEAQGLAREALDRANEAHKLAEGKFLYEVVLSDESVKFGVDGAALSPEARARLDELVARLRNDNHNVYIEIQGFTDARGGHDHNLRLGEARAESVRRYLHHKGVALNRMSTISYGEEAPVASNATPKGRAQNRRVTIVVLA